MRKLGWIWMMGIGLTSLAFGADWPQFRGPTRDGISLEKGWFKAGVTARTVWETELGVGHAAVALQAGRLYTMGNRDDKDVVYCLDALTGKRIWDYSYPCRAGNYPGPRSTPTIEGRRVFTLSREGLFLCLDAAKGTVLWKRDLGREMKAKPPSWGFASSPLVMGNLVVVNVGSSGLAVDKATGATKWSSGGEGASYASPVAITIAGRAGVLVFGTEEITAVDAATGRKVWAHPWKTDCDVNAADPVVTGDKVLISSGYGHGAALLTVTGATPKVEWENKKLVSHFSSPVLSGLHVYGIHGDAGEGDLRCVDLATGAVKWLNGEVGFGSLTMADGKLIVLSEKGTLAIIEDDPEACREVWSQKVLDGVCWTMPTLCNGLIYCRNDKGRLICLDLRGL
jgi:outer membrane protein assembly factor BamB